MLRVACGERTGAEEGFNVPESQFSVETPDFSGSMYFRFHKLENEPEAYFAGKQRLLSCIVQGTVKQRIRMSECFTGYEFQQPLQHVPARFLIGIALRFIRTIAPTLVEDVLGPKPYLLNPLFQTVQLLNVSLPGDEPCVPSMASAGQPVPEDTALLGGIFSERPLDRLERKKYFASARNAARHELQPDLVYTFEFYEDKVDPLTFDLSVAGIRISLPRHLGGQPLQIMGKVGSAPHSTRYLFNVEMWHEHLLRQTGEKSGSSSPWGGKSIGVDERSKGHRAPAPLRSQQSATTCVLGNDHVVDHVVVHSLWSRLKRRIKSSTRAKVSAKPTHTQECLTVSRTSRAPHRV